MIDSWLDTVVVSLWMAGTIWLSFLIGD